MQLQSPVLRTIPGLVIFLLGSHKEGKEGERKRGQKGKGGEGGSERKVEGGNRHTFVFFQFL